ncbi:methionyl-tRNA formyltransferase [Kyrpidia spormannii]|uniref:Methionyl-tRNA formyltransferase n=2 Tax=Kyrpidia spormannii TaxID=2055160 RepID=A0ACA8ZDP3_9BACL|nr:methionyl-tRNA formyltransferase [Kyrpidia spormannii]CAB3392688.1 methionyl-tRNA formyltransferase [Kyrpidia spormannii]CAB3393602.1 methionyl-tRNA formyltransferase [Kyrpidia spormannii]
MTNVLFMGTPEFAVPSLRALVKAGWNVGAVVTRPDRPVGRRQVPSPPAVKRAAEELGLPVWQPERVKDEEFLRRVRDLAPEVAVTAAYGRILPQELLDLPPRGCLNIHASLLPKYRGAAPIQRCLMDGQDRTGITIMKMVQALDAGPIVDQVELAVGEEDDAGTLTERLADLGARLLVDVLPRWLAGEIEPREQDESLATYAPPLCREDEKIDWSQAALAIHNRIRALRPWSGGYTLHRGKVLKIWRTTVEARTGGFGAPGEILAVDRSGVLVAAGAGALWLHQVQPEGKNRMEAEAWARGRRIETGESLGT